MTIVSENITRNFISYQNNQELSPLLLLGNALSALQDIPDNSIDFCMTSPPYWGKRQYDNGGLGLEKKHEDYISKLVAIFSQIRRILKPTGSFWLNMGDSYLDKRLLGIPWRVTFALSDQQGWILRNEIIWNKVKGGPDNTKDRLRTVHEQIFHFVKTPKGYYYNVDVIRANPKKIKIVNGAVVSATGVTGVRYKRQIELSTQLTDDEKKAANEALDNMLEKLTQEDISDFRMIIR
ncbi:MAG: site-specific DNA-methyltransferase, partial [Anaerolineaceae bacterium 4572_5.2]